MQLGAQLDDLIRAIEIYLCPKKNTSSFINAFITSIKKQKEKKTIIFKLNDDFKEPSRLNVINKSKL